jgi:cyclopropane fatty-acyl-phospholipid synthase-like methyltransferase
MPERIVVEDPAKPHLGGNIKGGDEMTWFPELWDWLINTFEPKSILDIGCGEGHLMKYFFDRFIEVHGIEGMQKNKDNAPEIIKNKIVVHDYTKGCCYSPYIDMVISCEFVEHVEETFIKNFLINFCTGRTLVLTHALPHQDGYHHVNCQTDDYWIQIFNRLGYSLSPVTDEARVIAEKYNKTLWKTILIFK